MTNAFAATSGTRTAQTNRGRAPREIYESISLPHHEYHW
jgi:hypothetical protein